MSKKIGYSICVIILILSLVGCSGSSAEKKELQNFIDNVMPPIGVLEIEVQEAYDNCIGENYIDISTSYKILNDIVIPKSRQLITQIEEIHINSKQLRDLNEKYIESLNIQHTAYIQMVLAIEQDDP